LLVLLLRKLELGGFFGAIALHAIISRMTVWSTIRSIAARVLIGSF